MSETCSVRASTRPAGITDIKVTSQSIMPQLMANSGGNLKTE
jgi:hypothetical protein